jgi:hypothetical protein
VGETRLDPHALTTEQLRREAEAAGLQLDDQIGGTQLSLPIASGLIPGQPVRKQRAWFIPTWQQRKRRSLLKLELLSALADGNHPGATGWSHHPGTSQQSSWTPDRPCKQDDSRHHAQAKGT